MKMHPTSNYENSDAPSWRDRYHDLQQDRRDLAQKLNNSEEANRLLKTKYAKLEATLRRSMTTAAGGGNILNGGQPTLSVSEKQELEDMLNDAQTQHARVLKDYKVLEWKHKKLLVENEKQKKEISSMKRRLSGLQRPYSSSRQKPSYRRNSPSIHRGATRNKKAPSNDRSLSVHDDIGCGEDTHKESLVKKVESLTRENDLLRSAAVAQDPTEVGYITNFSIYLETMSHNTLKTEAELKSKLHASRLNEQLIQSKYKNLVKKEEFVMESAMKQVKEYSTIITDLRTELHNIQMSKIKSDQAASYCEEQQIHIEELTKHNQALEERIIHIHEKSMRPSSRQDFSERIDYVNEIGTLKLQLRDKEDSLTRLNTKIQILQKDKVILTSRLNSAEKIQNKIHNLMSEPLVHLLEGVTHDDLERALKIIQQGQVKNHYHPDNNVSAVHNIAVIISKEQSTQVECLPPQLPTKKSKKMRDAEISARQQILDVRVKKRMTEDSKYSSEDEIEDCVT